MDHIHSGFLPGRKLFGWSVEEEFEAWLVPSVLDGDQAAKRETADVDDVNIDGRELMGDPTEPAII